MRSFIGARSVHRAIPVGAWWTACLVLTLTSACQGPVPPSEDDAGTISVRRVADYIHTVIEADRATYADRVVQRLQNEEEVIQASEHFEDDRALPLPAQMLRMGAERASERADLRYSLISPWAINKANLPRTDFERRGLEALEENPETVFTETVTVGGKPYFMALYADLAVSPACVTCHNDHADSPRDDFEVGGVMGGLVIAIPLSDSE